MKFKRILFLLLFAILVPINVNARRGCCSHHGGVSHCNTSIGKYICNDGTESPSCTCEKIVTTKKTTKSTSTTTTSSSTTFLTINSTTSLSIITIGKDSSNNVEDKEKEDSNDTAAIVGGLGIIGAIIAVIANRNKFKKK